MPKMECEFPIFHDVGTLPSNAKLKHRLIPEPGYVIDLPDGTELPIKIVETESNPEYKVAAEMRGEAFLMTGAETLSDARAMANELQKQGYQVTIFGPDGNQINSSPGP